jgi:hypothetical protein
VGQRNQYIEEIPSTIRLLKALQISALAGTWHDGADPNDFFLDLCTRYIFNINRPAENLYGGANEPNEGFHFGAR